MGVGRREFATALLVLCAALAGCGKKGPPLAPIVHVPAAVDKLSAQRVGDDVYLTITIPTQNIDASTPADVSRIDVFAATSLTPPPAARFFEIASRVASIDVQPPPPPAGKETNAPAPPQRAGLPTQGSTVTIRETLTPDALVPKTLPSPPGRTAATGVTGVTGEATTAPSATLRRFYVAVAANDRGRTGPPGALRELPLPPLPDAPAAPMVEQAPGPDDHIVISWEPSGGILGFLFERPAALEEPPIDEVRAPNTPPAAATAGPVLYNVYREPRAEEPQAAAASTLNVAPPMPLNAVPLSALTFTDSSPFEYGQERCYTVRAVRGAGAAAIVGPASPPGCITPEDHTPPAAPTGLAALGAEGVINLSWEPNGEADLAGYLVLRGRAGDATLQPLTSSPLMGTSYADRDVTAGVRYVYAVKAVDNKTPPNVSDESNRAEDTAR